MPVLQSYQRIRRKQCSSDSVQVGKCELDGGVGKSELVQIGGTDISWTDVTLPGEWRNCDSVL